jgi:hypothetical protein
MTDYEFVLWYINKHYLFLGSKFKLKYNISNPIDFYEFLNNVGCSLAIKTDDLHLFLMGWKNQKIKEYKTDILDFIKYKYKVKLGNTNWIISTMSGKQVSKTEIYNVLKNKYDYDFLENILDDWFENEIIKISEKTILNFK